MLLVWLFAATRVCAMEEERITNLNLNDGLAGETVYRVITDHCGYVWMATSGGVNLFNGHHLTTFPILGSQGQRLTVYDLCELADHQLWAATEEGLYFLTMDSNGFEPALPEVEAPISLLAAGDTLYIGSQQGLHFFDGQRLQHLDVDVSRSGLDNIVRQYLQDDDGLIWFLGRFDLNSYDPQTGRVTHHQPSLSDMRMPLSQFAHIGGRRFVVGSRLHGLFLCDLSTGTTERIEGVGNIVTSVQRCADGDLCVACDGTGAFRLDGQTLAIKEQFHTDGDPAHRLPSNGTYCYYRDANGVNWFGFVRYGLAYTYHSGDLFRVFQVPADGGGDFSAEGINVRSFCRHGDDVILGTQSGFYHVNARTGQHHYYSPADLGGGHIVNALAWYDGLFYIGTFDGGLRTFDPQTQTLRHQSLSPLLDEKSVGELKVGPDGRLWIGCSDGLMIVKGQQLQQHFTEQNSPIVGGLIISITFDADGNAWLTGADGCSVYSVYSRSIVDTDYPKGFFNCEPWMRGAQGHDGLILMRTGPRTFYTNREMTDFGELQLPVSISDKWCRSMVDDMQGHYLIASEWGLLRLDYALSTMQHLGYGEGLRGDFINDLTMEPGGRLWVGTSQGLFYSDLSQLDTWQHDARYQVRLYDLRRGSDLLTPAEEYQVNESHEIRLSWNITSEVLQLKALLLDYSKQTGRLYEFRLDDSDWQRIADGEETGLRRLLPGRHRLELRLAGAEGSAASYSIIVVPSLWAILALLLLITALVMFYLWLRQRRQTKLLLTERNEIEDALIEMEEKEALWAERQEEREEEESNSTKYQQVKMSDEECEDIVGRMRHYLETDHAYTNQELKRVDLARVLHVPVAKLSYVFSMYLGENYYEFINRYRLERFKQLIAEGAYKRFTLTALSEQCGFKKSSFFSTFRKVEGMTPTEYLKHQNIKIGL